MAEIGLTEAARLTGKDPSTIARRSNHPNIKKRLSFTINEHGERLYDVAELERVFGKLRNPAEAEPDTERNKRASLQCNIMQEPTSMSHLREIALLHEQTALLQKQLDITGEDRDHWRRQATYLLEDKSKNEKLMSEQERLKGTLSEQITREQVEKEQLEKKLSDVQARLGKVRSSWIGRLLFQV